MYKDGTQELLARILGCTLCVMYVLYIILTMAWGGKAKNVLLILNKLKSSNNNIMNQN